VQAMQPCRRLVLCIFAPRQPRRNRQPAPHPLHTPSTVGATASDAAQGFRSREHASVETDSAALDEQ